MGIVLDEKDKLNLIRLEGAIDINCAAELKSLLLTSLASGNNVSVLLDGVTYLDVTAVQLLWAAEREAKASLVEFMFVGQLPQQVATDLAGAGFEKFSFQQPQAG